MLPNDEWTDLEPDRVQSSRGFPGENDEQEDPVMQGLHDDVARGLRLVTRVANSDRGHGAGVLDAGVSASMITEQEVLTDQQHRSGDVHE